MQFEQFADQVANRMKVLAATGKLFVSSVSGHDLSDLYLNSFKPEHKNVFRDPDSNEHNCNLDKAFIRRYGNIVALDENYNTLTLWDVDVPEDSQYYNSAKALNAALKAAPIKDVFFETFAELNEMNYGKVKKTDKSFRLGIQFNDKMYTKEEADKFGKVKEGKVYRFYHFYTDLPKQFVDVSGKSQAEILGNYREPKNVFLRGLTEISVDTYSLVKDLITQGSLLDGTTHLYKIDQMIPIKKEFDAIAAKDRDNYAWVKSYGLPFAKFRNELMGTLCVELTEGKELNEAVKTWNKRVDPANYMKVTAPITKRQIEEAKKFVEENGYIESFARRFATIDDINVSEIAHSNVGDGKIKTASIFDSVKPAVSTRHKRSEFAGVEEVSIEKFMKDILPSCTSVEAFLENRMTGNLVTLTTSAESSKPIFKWNNPFSWTFNGNLAGKSQLAQMVEAKGGRVDGAFRFTHSWNKLEKNQSLMDLHVFMPGCTLPRQGEGGPNVTGRRVGWNERTDSLSGGVQDVDYTDAAPTGYIPVENITFPELSKMPEGKYTCMIHNWNFRNTGGKGEAEIAFGGEVFQYVYPATKNHEWITVAEVTLSKGVFTIEHKLPEATSSKAMWGLDSNQFHKVNLVCLSPNHWGDNNVGNKHYFFMLDKCASDIPIRSFHNENLIGELLEHRKVMEVLGQTNMLEPSTKQLAGLGFNATVGDELILKLSGSFKRTVKVKF